MRLIKTLRFYGYVKFEPCVTNYPHDNSNVIIAAGNKEMIFRIEIAPVNNKYRYFFTLY